MPEQVGAAAPVVHATEQDSTVSCRPFTVSWSRTLDEVAHDLSVTALSGVVPSLTRSTRALRESPASIIPPENGRDAPPGWLTSIETSRQCRPAC